MTTPTIIKHFVKSPAVGKGVLLWLAVEGQQVETGQPIARFSVGAVAHSLLAPCTGRLVCNTPSNTTLASASVVGWVNEGETGTAAASQKPLQEPTRPAPVAEGNTAARRGTPQPRPTVQATEAIEPPAPELHTRRNAHVAELVIEDLTPSKRKPPKKRKMVNRTYSIAPDDEEEITRLAAALGKMRGAPGDLNESLLVRVAIAQLVQSAKSVEGVSALIEAIEDRIKVEAAAGVGAGRRRKSRTKVL